MELDDETILWLDRLNTEQRSSLIYFGNLPVDRRDKLSAILGLPKEQHEALVRISELWTRLSWMGRTSVKIVLIVAGLLVALSQISTYFSSGGPPK